MATPARLGGCTAIKCVAKAVARMERMRNPGTEMVGKTSLDSISFHPGYSDAPFNSSNSRVKWWRLGLADPAATGAR